MFNPIDNINVKDSEVGDTDVCYFFTQEILNGLGRNLNLYNWLRPVSSTRTTTQ